MVHLVDSDDSYRKSDQPFVNSSFRLLGDLLTIKFIISMADFRTELQKKQMGSSALGGGMPAYKCSIVSV